MNPYISKDKIKNWKVEKIGVVGPGIVGMPMAALLAGARIKIGQSEPTKVVVVQRNSRTSGWKVDAINSGKSTIGGIEPELDNIVFNSVNAGILSASHDYTVLRDADVILICVQTDKKGFQPEYEPLLEAVSNIANTLKDKPAEKVPLVIFESTLAPSTMESVIKKYFAKFGLIEGRDILLGNSPNRVMPGRLVERIRKSDKLAGGLDPLTPALIKYLYSFIVTEGNIFQTNSLTAEVVKTLENAYRDVRIAYSSEISRYCDFHNISYYDVRDKVNHLLNQKDNASNDPNFVPSGGMLIPTIGVGGHCLPKDGILLWWRKLEKGDNTSYSLIMHSRKINDNSHISSIQLAEMSFDEISNKNISLLGAAYRFNSEDTRNSPTFLLAQRILEKGCNISIHDPYVKPTDQNLEKYNLSKYFTNDLDTVLNNADYIFMCTAHSDYLKNKNKIINASANLKGIFDGCNVYKHSDFINSNVKYSGIGRGTKEAGREFINYVYNGFRVVEKGFANELKDIIEFLNRNYSSDDFNCINFTSVRKLAGSCSTGCNIVEPEPVNEIPSYNGLISQLIKCSYDAKVSYEQV